MCLENQYANETTIRVIRIYLGYEKIAHGGWAGGICLRLAQTDVPPAFVETTAGQSPLHALALLHRLCVFRWRMAHRSRLGEPRLPGRDLQPSAQTPPTPLGPSSGRAFGTFTRVRRQLVASGGRSSVFRQAGPRAKPQPSLFRLRLLCWKLWRQTDPCVFMQRGLDAKGAVICVRPDTVLLSP